VWSTYVIVAVLAAIVVALGLGLRGVVRGHKNHPAEAVRALTWRIALSVALFVLLLIGFATGLIEPHGVQREFGPAPAQTQ
jgi:hypothetical protein